MLKFVYISRENITVYPKVCSDVIALLNTKVSSHKSDLEVVGVAGQGILISTKWQFTRSKVFTEHLLCVRYSARGLKLLMIGKGI